MNDVSLEHTVFGLKFKNPVLAASGTFGYGEVYSDFYDVSLLGGFVTKSVTPEPRVGNPSPRIIETPSGMLNAIGLQNKGLEHFINSIAPAFNGLDTVIMVNVAGRTVDDYVRVCSELDTCEAVQAFEINISCPNVREGGIAFGTDAETAASLTTAVRATTKKSIVIKLSPNVTDITAIARAVEEAGADAVSLINTITGMVVDVESRHPMLANITGGLSGPAIRPIAVRMVYQVARTIGIPVIGIGGIFGARDALEFIIAGASLVQAGCGMFVKPCLPLEIIEGIREYMVAHGMRKLTELIGSITLEGE